MVGLVERAAERGLVHRQNAAVDRRQVLVTLTPRGEEILNRLSRLHHDEVRRVKAGILSHRRSPRGRPTAAATSKTS